MSKTRRFLYSFSIAIIIVAIFFFLEFFRKDVMWRYEFPILLPVSFLGVKTWLISFTALLIILSICISTFFVQLKQNKYFKSLCLFLIAGVIILQGVFIKNAFGLNKIIGCDFATNTFSVFEVPPPPPWWEPSEKQGNPELIATEYPGENFYM